MQNARLDYARAWLREIVLRFVILAFMNQNKEITYLELIFDAQACPVFVLAIY
jgi:hypothetical protein